MARSLLQHAVTAAVVATLFYVPVGLATLLILRVFGVPYDSVVSFGGALGMFSGLFAWWLLTFILAYVYVAIVSRA